MVKTIIAYCGLVCWDCGAYIATQKNDDTLRKEQAEKWTKQYNHPFKTEDINCDGCNSKGRHIGYCAVCQIRICAVSKGVTNCGYCVSYPCAKVETVTNNVPAAKKNLETAKKGKK